MTSVPFVKVCSEYLSDISFQFSSFISRVISESLTLMPACPQSGKAPIQIAHIANVAATFITFLIKNPPFFLIQCFKQSYVPDNEKSNHIPNTPLKQLLPRHMPPKNITSQPHSIPHRFHLSRCLHHQK